jgi:hypothetical protein
LETVCSHPVYFGNLAHFVALKQAADILWEVHDNYQKQTLRNRMYIYGANGRLMLNIPIKHGRGIRQKSAAVLLENNFEWQTNHWRSLCAAYRSSPYFEYYEDDFYPLFHTKYERLMDWNLACMHLVMKLLKWQVNFSKTVGFSTVMPPDTMDIRSLAASKKHAFTFESYTQVFQDKPHIGNLCILDLLFNLGPDANGYLDRQFALIKPLLKKVQ